MAYWAFELEIRGTDMSDTLDGLDVDEVEAEEGAEEDVAPVDAASPVAEGFAEIARKCAAQEKLTDEELDSVADEAIGIVRTMLSYFDITGVTIDEYDGDEGQLILNVTGADLGILIGYHGKVLESFQYMFTALLNAHLGFRYPVVVDIEGYDSRRTQKIRNLARGAARKALQRGAEVRLHPMKAYERRLVHLALRGDPKVLTRSEGTEPNRCVVVIPKDR